MDCRDHPRRRPAGLRRRTTTMATRVFGQFGSFLRLRAFKKTGKRGARDLMSVHDVQLKKSAHLHEENVRTIFASHSGFGQESVILQEHACAWQQAQPIQFSAWTVQELRLPPCYPFATNRFRAHLGGCQAYGFMLSSRIRKRSGATGKPANALLPPMHAVNPSAARS